MPVADQDEEHKLLRHWDSVTSARSGTAIAPEGWKFVQDEKTLSSLFVENDTLPLIATLTNGELGTVRVVVCPRLDCRSRYVDSDSGVVVEAHVPLAVHPAADDADIYMIKFEVNDICETLCEACDRYTCKCNKAQRLQRLENASRIAFDAYISSLMANGPTPAASSDTASEVLPENNNQETPSEPPLPPAYETSSKADNKSCCIVS